MRFLTLFLISLTLLSVPAAADVLRVLTTTADLKSLTETIGGEHVSVESLGRGNQNYHFLAAKPSYMLKANRADLFIRIGLDLEIGYEPLILEGARNPRIQPGQSGYLDASDGITPLDVPERVDRSMGDVHAEGNPHYWLDPENTKIIARSIAARLSELDPEHAHLYQSNLTDYIRRVDGRMAEWQKALAPFQGEKLVGYHSTWTYFARRFGLDAVMALEPKPGVPPSPGHLRQVVEQVTRDNIKVILTESIYKTNAADYVADRTSAVVVVAPISVGGVKGAEDVIALMDILIQRLKDGFERAAAKEASR